MASWWKSDALQIYGIQVIGLCYDFCISLVVSYVVGQTLHELSTFTALCDWWSACVHKITTARHARSLPHCCHQLSSCMWMLLPARRWTSTKLHLRNASKVTSRLYLSQSLQQCVNCIGHNSVRILQYHQLHTSAAEKRGSHQHCCCQVNVTKRPVQLLFEAAMSSATDLTSKVANPRGNSLV